MMVSVAATAIATEAVQPKKRRFTAHEYLKMAELGILAPDEKLELIDGEIYKKMSPVGLPHIWCVMRLTKIFERVLGNKVFVSVQNPLRLDDYNEPEPDVVLFPLEAMNRQPTAKDALLVVEVSDSTLNLDRKVKLPLYARFDVVEVWIVNLSEKRLEAYREAKEGVYRQVMMYDETEAIAPVKFETVSFSVGEILGTKPMEIRK
jgi:Uma2 family endonuclease